MTIPQYNKWSGEICQQQDLIISTQQYQRMCNVFIKDVWLDILDPRKAIELKAKATIMFELQGHFVK
jgi:hypothetical protein